MIKLKDCVIVDVIDDEEEFSEFGGTWSEDIITHMHNLTFITDTGKTINLESYSEGYYGGTNGFLDVGGLYTTILKEVFSGEMAERTLVEFIQWIVSEYARNSVIIQVNNKKGLLHTTIRTERHPIFYEQQVISWYLEELKKEIREQNKKQNKKRGVRPIDWSGINKLKEQAKMIYTPTKEVFALADDRLGLPQSNTLEEFLED